MPRVPRQPRFHHHDRASHLTVPRIREPHGVLGEASGSERIGDGTTGTVNGNGCVVTGESDSRPTILLRPANLRHTESNPPP